jgi:hypothetical protein
MSLENGKQDRKRKRKQKVSTYLFTFRTRSSPTRDDNFKENTFVMSRLNFTIPQNILEKKVFFSFFSSLKFFIFCTKKKTSFNFFFTRELYVQILREKQKNFLGYSKKRTYFVYNFNQRINLQLDT